MLFNRQFNWQFNTKQTDLSVLPVSYIHRYFYGIYEKGIVTNWWQGIYDQLIKQLINRLFVIFNFVNRSVNSWTCQLYFCRFKATNWENEKLMHVYDEIWLWLIGFALVYGVGVNERENPKSHIEMFQSSIYYYVRINRYIRLGAKYADVGCMYMETLGYKYAVVGCKSMERLGACLTVFACLTVGSYTLHVYPLAWAQGPPGAPGPNNQNNQSIKQ